MKKYDLIMALRYYPLINKLITTLKIQERLAIPVDTSNPEQFFIKPFITVAREPGSGGSPIAQTIAKKLDFTFIDEQIVDEIAESTQKRKAIIKAIDEKSRTRIEDMIHSMLNEQYVDELKYLQELVRVILAYALKGHVVILGRGANFMTPFAKGLHVNITAPYEVRVQRAMEFEGLTKPQAKKIIAEVEHERKAFVKQYLRHDITKCNSYDLTLNTTYYRVEEAADVVIDAFYKKFSRSVRYSALLKK